MADDWDDPIADSQSQGKGFAAEGGRTFSRGRGFSAAAAKPSNGNEDSWGDSSGGFGGGGGGFGGGARRGGGFRNRDKNENGGNSWGGNKNTDDGGWAGGKGNSDEGGWGDNGGNEDRPRRGGRGGFRGGRGDRGGRGGGNRRDDDRWGGGGGNRREDDSWGGGGGGNRRDDDSWGGGGGGGAEGGDEGEGWKSNDNNGNGFGEGRGRGRGGRGGRGRGGGRGGRNRDGDGEGSSWGGGEGGDDGGKEEPAKPREIYVPPEPTNDENELFNTGISSGINFIKYDDIEVKVSGENVPTSITSFEEGGFRKLLLENIQKSQYKTPTPIQKHAIPIIMAGRDIMACAQTGSGKTAAFLLPIINSLIAEPQDLVVDGDHCEPQAIIVSPTRELTIQIYEETRKFSHNSCIKVAIAYGGTSVGYQRKHVMNGCHILVATPGRMNDFVTRGHITFSSTRFVVLDEADRMLDMGFLPNMEEMLGHASMVPTGERKTLMFSATFPEEIQRLAAKFLDNYVFVTVGIVGGACTDVTQVIHQVDRVKKRNKLVEILREEGTERTLVFVETKRNADFLATYLSENDFQSTSIHGDRLQREREEALRDFKRGHRNILVATAVAARGLDIKNVKHVINYDLPKSIDEYVHRIGRTGRLGNSGKATSFFDETQDGPIAGDLARILKQAQQPVPDWLGHCGGGTYSSSAFGGHDVRGDTFDQQSAVEVQDEEW